MALNKNEALSRLNLLIGESNRQLLENKTILIVGIGGVGSFAAEALARSGIGKIILVDYDVIVKSNLNRQIHTSIKTIGEKKVFAMKKRINEIAPWCQVETYAIEFDEEKEYLFEDIDFVVDAIDDIKSKVSLIKISLENEIPIISCLGMANRLDSSLLEVTRLDKTYNDPFAKILRNKLRQEKISLKFPVVFSKELPIVLSVNNELPSSIFVPSSAGILCASYVVRVLIDKD